MMKVQLITFLQEAVDIEQKIKEAPDKSYEIGVVIGAFLPFIVLAGIAYAIYFYRKKRNGNL
jgi:hypothetical protein